MFFVRFSADLDAPRAAVRELLRDDAHDYVWSDHSLPRRWTDAVKWLNGSEGWHVDVTVDAPGVFEVRRGCARAVGTETFEMGGSGSCSTLNYVLSVRILGCTFIGAAAARWKLRAYARAYRSLLIRRCSSVAVV